MSFAIILAFAMVAGILAATLIGTVLTVACSKACSCIHRFDDLAEAVAGMEYGSS